LACLSLLLVGKTLAQTTPPNDLADWAHSHFDTIIEYKTANGDHWQAKLNGTKFIHAPNGDFSPGKIHEDTIIEYQAWDGRAWIAKLNGKGGFTHTNQKNPADTHDDVIIGYVTWNNEWWEAILEKDGGKEGFRHAQLQTNQAEQNCGVFGPHRAETTCPSKISHAVCDACAGGLGWGKASCHCDAGPALKPTPTPAPMANMKYYVIGEYFCVDAQDPAKGRGSCTMTTWNSVSCESAKQTQDDAVSKTDVCQTCPNAPNVAVDPTRVWNKKRNLIQEGPCANIQ
jgi:hypothetical protein